MKYDIVIVGAGAAGLMAMRQLLQRGYNVCILEAAAVAGGRIRTVYNHDAEESIEAGAEFIHGDLPLTKQLLNDAGISYTKVEGEMINVKNGVWQNEEQHDPHWKQFTKQLEKVKEDITIRSFLEEYFSDAEFADLRLAVEHFAEGFDLADISKASVLAIKKEWAHENENQYRIDGGYTRLINYLEDECKKKNGFFQFNSSVTGISYTKEQATARTTNGDSYTAAKVIVTVSAGILQSGSISFEPRLPAYNHAMQELGFGSVIKFLLFFKTNFWKDRRDDIGFILSDEQIPTWWTQLPRENNLLTGWLGGPLAVARSNEPDEALLAAALLSLSNIFQITPQSLRENLAFHKIVCWHNDHHTKGGYSYETVESAAAKLVLLKPVDNTIYFAGEAIYSGDSPGTVEAALQSGKSVAQSIIGDKKA